MIITNIKFYIFHYFIKYLSFLLIKPISKKAHIKVCFIFEKDFLQKEIKKYLLGCSSFDKFKKTPENIRNIMLDEKSALKKGYINEIFIKRDIIK